MRFSHRATEPVEEFEGDSSAFPMAGERLYRHRLFAIALCQEAALHYLDGQNGGKDLDFWRFFKANPKRPFPYRIAEAYPEMLAAASLAFS